ncbi:hypothetical protein Cni_G21589 [Canna indica]|uniref:Uncharacterized protein n=1 Tax=Canna indica TaxID=4628 RepID=A0AAQ3KV77_9LILI|nr:hypothetical protein Cni_G21589 [Canna indica]
MAVNGRTKRVMIPFDEEAKARLWGGEPRTAGYSSSGSEHEALHSLVHVFFDCDVFDSHSSADAATGESGTGNSDADEDARASEAADAVSELLRARGDGDPLRFRLASDVCAVAEALAPLRPSGSGFRRAVMARLRELGYNAGVCKARWESAGGLVAGSYEYIDVLSGDDEARRYIVDLGFASEFRVARASQEYERVAAALTEVVVARPEEVRQVVRIVGEAARRSIKAQGLHVPPWRKGRYMMAKWLGPYRRTVNAIPTSAVASVAGGGGEKCSVQGFTLTRERHRHAYVKS